MVIILMHMKSLETKKALLDCTLVVLELLDIWPEISYFRSRLKATHIAVLMNINQETTI